MTTFDPHRVGISKKREFFFDKTLGFLLVGAACEIEAKVKKLGFCSNNRQKTAKTPFSRHFRAKRHFNDPL